MVGGGGGEGAPAPPPSLVRQKCVKSVLQLHVQFRLIASLTARVHGETAQILGRHVPR